MEKVAGFSLRAPSRQSATILLNRMGLSGDPCRTPLVCGMLVMVSATAIRISLASSRPNQARASHGIPPAVPPPPGLRPPTLAATMSPMLSCQTLSNAFRMSSLTIHVGTPPFCGMPHHPPKDHQEFGGLFAGAGPLARGVLLDAAPPSQRANHLRTAELSVIGLVSPHVGGSPCVFGRRMVAPCWTPSGSVPL